MCALWFNDNTWGGELTIPLAVGKLKTDEWNHTTQAQSFITYLSLIYQTVRMYHPSTHTYTWKCTKWLAVTIN